MAVGGMDLNLLVALRALLEEVNVTRAGERLGLAQPAMSGSLARLRRHYRDELLVRVGRDYELTPFARSLLPTLQHAMPMIEMAFGLRDDFDPVTSTRKFSITLSDYALTVLNAPLLHAISGLAPGLRLDLSPIPSDSQVSERGLLQYDFLVGPLGCGFQGNSEVIFRDRFVCVVDPRNERLADGTLQLKDFKEMPHAVATFGPSLTPVDGALSSLDIGRDARVTTVGWLSLPFVVAGTDLVAVMPERLARRTDRLAHVTTIEPPFGRIDLVEALWWHPTREPDAGHRWLLGILRDLAASIEAGHSASGASSPVRHDDQLAGSMSPTLWLASRTAISAPR